MKSIPIPAQLGLRAQLGTATGPRGRPGSQRPRTQMDVQINSAASMHWNALRAGTASRSVPVARRAMLVAVSRCALGLMVAAFVSASAGEPAEWHPARAPLMTRWATQVNPTNALPEYPRPQLVRPDWLNLNGLWDYAVTPDSVDQQPPAKGKILVPFPLESSLSGVMTNLDEH